MVSVIVWFVFINIEHPLFFGSPTHSPFDEEGREVFVARAGSLVVFLSESYILV